MGSLLHPVQDHLLKLARENREKYNSADPFPHIVLDDFLPDSLIQKALAEIPVLDHTLEKKTVNTHYKVNFSADRFHLLGDTLSRLLYELNSSFFVKFLEELTGIEGLVSDPHYLGGGVHQIGPGGFLKIHADFNWHQRLKLDRRINFLLYLNPEWKEEYGGHLELWDTKMKGCVKKVLPIFNRCVVFSTTDYSFHGHPDPLTCPPERRRNSIALYYYTNGRPAQETRFKGSDRTYYRERPGETLEPKTWRKYVKEITPPVVFEVLHALRQRKN